MTFGAQSWTQIREFLTSMSEQHGEFSHMTDVVDSILSSGVADELAGATSKA